MKKKFICYTTKDTEITEEFLRKVKIFYSFSGEVYIDLLDNDSEDKQWRVLYELDRSDCLVLIQTKSIYDSKWVQIELERAKYNKIEICIVAFEDLLSMLDE